MVLNLFELKCFLDIIILFFILIVVVIVCEY